MDKKKMLNIRTSPEIHKKIYALATIQGLSLNDAVNIAIEDYIKKHEQEALSLFTTSAKVTNDAS